MDININIDTEDEDVITETLVAAVLAWVTKGEGGLTESDLALKRLARLLNGAGAGIAHHLAQENSSTGESLTTEEGWLTSPKDIVLFLVENDALWDKEKLAHSWNGFQEYKYLETMFNLPFTEKEQDEE